MPSPAAPRHRLYPLAILAALAAALLPSFAQANPRAAAVGFEAAVDSYLAPAVRTNNFSGVVLVARGDRVLLHKAYGEAVAEHSVPNRPDTRFHIASVSKPFTAAAIMLLAERGRIDLHAPLARVLPDYPNGSALTIHHLLSHMSGIPNINDFPEYAEVQYRPHSLESLVAYFRDRPLGFRPGERFEYSNSNYNLLALIVERVSGMPFGEFLRREIFAPLGMSGTGHRGRMEEIVPALATGYAARRATGIERARYLDWTVKTGNGSLYTTASDLLLFFRALHGGRLLAPASLSVMFTEHSENVGYGWFLTRANGRRLRHINGRSPGWAAQADHYPDEDVTVLVLSNVYSSITTPLARAIGAIHFGEPHRPLPDLGARAVDPAQAAPLAGRYRMGPDYYVPNQLMTIALRDGDLVAVDERGNEIGGLIPITATKFIFRPFWMEVEFVPGPGGRAGAITVGGFRGERAE